MDDGGPVDMLDFHTHILPDIDDGAADAETSWRMIERLAAQGVRKICLTPHYYSFKEPLGAFLERRDEAFKKLSEGAGRHGQVPLLRKGERMDNADGVELVLGAEVSLNDEVPTIDGLDRLCLGGSRLLLVELPYVSKSMEHDLYILQRMVNNSGVVPVMAHVERYPEALREKAFRRMTDMGCLMQMNLDVVKGGFLMIGSARRQALKRFAAGEVHFLGTDCHNMSRRPPEYTAHYHGMEKRFGAGFMDEFSKKAGALSAAM